MKRRIMFLITLLWVCAQIIHADSPAPGGPCTEQDATYNYVTDVVKSAWTLNELYAVPPGTGDPDAWDQKSSFGTQFQASLGSGTTPHAFAQACVSVWQNFFATSATVLFSVQRTITGTEVALRCTGSTWSPISTQSIESQDVSDWITAQSGPFDVTDGSSATALEQNLEDTLTSLNQQPGAN